MNAITSLYAAILFVLLTPGLILRIPSKGSLLTASIVHAIVFGVLLYFISKLVHQYKYGMESFENQYQLFEDPDPENQVKCQQIVCSNAIMGGKGKMDPNWWSKDEGCEGCYLVKQDDNNNNKVCNFKHCTASIVGTGTLSKFTDNWWNDDQGCGGCTQPAKIISSYGHGNH